MANNPNVNKVVYGNQTIIDLTNDDVTPADVAEGVSFHDRSGAQQTGTGNYYSPNDTAETDIVDADYIPFYDTSALGKRKTLWSNVKAKLKAYFDGIYAIDYYDGRITTAGTQVTITNAGITADSVIISVLSNIANDKYSTIVCSNGSCVITFLTSAARSVRIYVDNR